MQVSAISLSYVPTANEINSTVLIIQIPRPSSNDQVLHDLFLTEYGRVTIGYWLSRGRVDRIQIGNIKLLSRPH